MAISTKTSSRAALLCVWLLVVLCGSASASNFGDDVRGVVRGVVENIQGAIKNVGYKVEDVFKYDLNKDGQIGEFRSQEDAIDTRQVGGDPNAAGRFQVYRPRTGRKLLADKDERKAAPAPMLRK